MLMLRTMLTKVCSRFWSWSLVKILRPKFGRDIVAKDWSPRFFQTPGIFSGILLEFWNFEALIRAESGVMQDMKSIVAPKCDAQAFGKHTRTDGSLLQIRSHGKKLAEKIFAIKGWAWLCMYTTTGHIYWCYSNSIRQWNHFHRLTDWLIEILNRIGPAWSSAVVAKIYLAICWAGPFGHKD